MPEEIRLAGGAARSQALRDDPRLRRSARRCASVAREEAGAAGAAMMAAVAASASIPTWRPAPPRWVDPLLGDRDRARPGAGRHLRPGFSRLSSRPARRCRPIWRALAGHAQRSAAHDAKIAIIGDRFMLPDVFDEAIRARCRRSDVDIRTHELPWPDEPMEHGYAGAGHGRA